MKLIWVTSANYLEGFKLKIEFNDGSSKVVDMEKHLNKPIFAPLRNISYFKQFRLNSFTIEWENGADFSPEFLYDLND